MPSRAANDTAELQLKILSEITDAVIVTDSDNHVVYWNGAAERLYNLPAGYVLGRLVTNCCPELASLIGSDGLHDEAVAFRETVLQKEARALHLNTAIKPLYDGSGRIVGRLTIQRDVTQIRALEMEVERCHVVMGSAARPVPAKNSSGEGRIEPCTKVVKDVILWAEDDDDDANLLSRAWRKADVDTCLIRVRDGAEMIAYLKGDGIYQDRQQYPLPSLLLLDMNMPEKSGPDVVRWLQEQPGFRDLPIVILTASSLRSDIHEVAGLGVKAYFTKPIDPAEWLVKVKSVTAQCR